MKAQGIQCIESKPSPSPIELALTLVKVPCKPSTNKTNAYSNPKKKSKEKVHTSGVSLRLESPNTNYPWVMVLTISPGRYL